MKVISLDLETSGLDKKKHTILEGSAVAFDFAKPQKLSECPKINKMIKVCHPKFESGALELHERTGFLKMWLEEKSKIEICDFANILSKFSLSFFGLEKIIFAGKNVAAFDLPFLKFHAGEYLSFQYHHRSVDPTMLYCDPIRDTVPPSLAECKRRAGLPDTTVAHFSLSDAYDILKVLLAKYGMEEYIDL